MNITPLDYIICTLLVFVAGMLPFYIIDLAEREQRR